MASDRSCPFSGHFLRVVTVYVVEEQTERGRRLRIALAADALGADPPHLLKREIDLEPGVRVELYSAAERPRIVVEGEGEVPHRRPLPALLQVVLNAVLYATSAGVQSQTRESPRTRGKQTSGSAPVFSSDSVFYLPGDIPISRVRRLQELSRVPGGRKLLHRFMVRGHWRRPAKNWKEQRMIWIGPYWKGPDIAAVIEKTYKMTP